MSTEGDGPTTTQRMTYIGQRLVDGLLRYGYATAEDLDGDTYWPLQKPLLAGVAVGTVVERTMLADGRWYARGADAPRVVGRHPDAAEVGRWVAISQAARANHQATRAAKTATSEVEQAMATLVRHYQGLSAPSRSGFLAWIISQLGVRA